MTSKRIETELSELLPRKIYEQPTQSFGMMMRAMANGTMANESIVREALHMPILCKDIEVFDKDGRTKRRKGSSIKSTDILVPASQRTMFFRSACDSPSQSSARQRRLITVFPKPYCSQIPLWVVSIFVALYWSG